MYNYIQEGVNTMIRLAKDTKVVYKEHFKGGDGTTKITNFINDPSDLNNMGRLYSRITLEPGASIGYHVHEGDRELFYFLQGTAEYNDNGEIRTVTAGDVAICPAGTGHSLANKTDETVEVIAVIVYEE